MNFVVIGIIQAFFLMATIFGQNSQLVFNSNDSSSEDLAVLAADVVITPRYQAVNASQHDIAIVFITGAQIPAKDYNEIATRIAVKCSEMTINAWVGIPSFFLDLALGKKRVAQKITDMYAKLMSHGMAKNTPVYLVGHSLGAASVQDYVMDSPADFPVHGSIFLGASLNRKYNGTVYPTPWMTIAGELDGLQRPTRVAQGYYHYILNPKYENPHINSSVVIIEGMNHMQFSSGKIPLAPKLIDLEPEINGTFARWKVAEIVSNFIASHVTVNLDSERYMKEMVDRTGVFMKPIISALEMEASAYLKKPCNSDNPSPHCPFYPAWPLQKEPRQMSNDTDCFCGTPWATVAINQMAGLSRDQRFQVHSVDAIHDVRDTKPFHHAHVWNNCTEGPFPCTLNLTTVSELKYDRFDNLDTGFTHATALEIRTKMKSRQVYWRHSVDPHAPYSVEDDSVCAKINELAVKWALETASDKARKRYEKFGQKIKFLPDYYFPISIGPLWINTDLKMYSKVVGGEKFLFIQSIAMKTEIDSWINRLHPDSGGQHYCKLLSPARVLEWIYTDGLRDKMGIQHLE